MLAPATPTRLLVVGYFLTANRPAITASYANLSHPIDIESVALATRQAIAQHGEAGDYQYVVTFSIDDTSRVLCTAADLVDATVDLDTEPTGAGRYVFVGYDEATHEAVIHRGVVASPEAATEATVKLLEKFTRHDTFLYLATLYCANSAVVLLTTDNLPVGFGMRAAS